MEMATLLVQEARQHFATGYYYKVARLLVDVRELRRRFCLSQTYTADVLHIEALLYTKLLRHAPATTPQEALKRSKISFDVRIRLLDPKDQKIAAAYGNMAIFAIACEQYTEALGYLGECLAIRLLQPEEQAASISFTYVYYGWCYAMMEEFNRANDILTKAVDVLVKRQGDHGAMEEPTCILIFIAQAYVYRKMGGMEEARQADRMAFELSKTIYGHLSPRTFVPWYKSAWWDWKIGNLHEANKSIRGLLAEMKKAQCYEGQRARALYLLARIQGAIGRDDDSKATMMLALESAASVEGYDWVRSIHVYWSCQDTPQWAKDEIERKFDELVFFNDR